MHVALSGDFFRILYQQDPSRLLAGAISREGRFHHDGQSALYLSPNPAAAARTVAAYVKANDPPRILARIALTGAGVINLRDRDTLTVLGLNGTEAATLWRPQRRAGLAATSWRASDAARATGACGMIYTSRDLMSRWHLVLFNWNRATGAPLGETGLPIRYSVEPDS